MVRVNVIKALKKVPPLEEFDMSLTIGERLRLLLTETNTFIYELSKISGLAKETISSLMRDRWIPRVPTALKLSKIFCVSPGVFLITPDSYRNNDLRIRFRNLRHLLGLKQNEFAQLCEIDPASIRDWETCTTQLSNKSRYYIEAVFSGVGAGSVKNSV
ncbi:helix-turn-helix transcriptional regulator [Desulforamulus aeronauticus]|uniref:HTH cro/C1-type domain-containing protein n=1 Tax=Desulforamulus aeronauticus DSM 10349 TaxID=1121421 RepID=A0A1M6VC47_9FIRM|nr:helix-turn-helix transcriptional regulator [Desulforamulus aeronauticus]SHK79040.1 hypothetical protein SAMN02745123_03126 [Desulforamulus aeronauticus DSM 10349]